ncbi:hypothetical protein AB3S75_006299 [Citrus x aurantiifolia]
MSKCYGNNVPVCTLLVAYIAIISMSSCPLAVEARIRNFSAIQESLVHKSTTEGLLHQRSLRTVPAGGNNPATAQGGHGHVTFN